MAALRIGSRSLASTGPDTLVVVMDLVRGGLSFRRCDSATGAVDWEASVTGLGLEDILVWSTGRTRVRQVKRHSEYVTLVLRLRAISCSSLLSPVEQARSLSMIRMTPLMAQSFLSCLCFGLVRTSMPKSDKMEESIVFLCGLLRKALARRDLLNRGWSDEQLSAGTTLLSLLATPDSADWKEQHSTSFLSCVARDARQFRFHSLVDVVNTTPTPTPAPDAAPPDKKQKQEDEQHSTAAAPRLTALNALTDAALFKSPEQPFKQSQHYDDEDAGMFGSFFQFLSPKPPPPTYAKGEKPKVSGRVFGRKKKGFLMSLLVDGISTVSQRDCEGRKAQGQGNQASKSIQNV